MNIMEVTDNKEIIKTLRLTKSEYELLKEEVDKSGLSFSNYIRIRLFDFDQLFPKRKEEDNKNRFNCDHDREMMRLMVRAYVHIDAIAGKALQPDVMQEIENKAAILLKKWGYEND